MRAAALHPGQEGQRWRRRPRARLDAFGHLRVYGHTNTVGVRAPRVKPSLGIRVLYRSRAPSRSVNSMEYPVPHVVQGNGVHDAVLYAEDPERFGIGNRNHRTAKVGHQVVEDLASLLIIG